MYISNNIFFIIWNIALLWFIYWAVLNGVINKDITFGLVGNVRKKGVAARNWGIIFVTIGIALFVWTWDIYLI